MAEAVISIAGSILANLITQALEKDGELGGVKDQLKLLEDGISTLRVVLERAEEQYYQSPQIKDWVVQLKDAFYEAQDVLEEFNIRAMRRELRGHNEMMKAVRTLVSCSKQLAFKKKMIDKVRVVRVRIEAFKANNIPTLKEHPKKELGNSEETHSFIRKEDIKGREDDKERVMKFLQDSNMEENVSILPIVGIGGLGKTALAKYVYGDSKFDLKMWVCVSTNFDVKKIVKKILACANEKEPTKDTMELLQRKLRKKIDKEKYLLVLDNVWSIEKAKWLSLKTLLEGGPRGSKILITTRDSLVAEITGTTQPHLLKGLSESASLDLLMQMAGQKIEEIQDSDIIAIGEEIVRKCSGVPLVVRTVGSLLFKKSKPEWLYFKDHELPKVSQRNDIIISVLRLSYDHLPSHLKQCFAFCLLFPKDYEMDKQKLVNLWVAEGFIQSNETCSVAGNECWAAGDGTKSIHERTRHISYGSTFNLMGGLPISHSKASALRTFLSTTRYWEEIKQRELEANLHKLIKSFKRLRILGLHGTKVEKVPRSIHKLKHLTYLDLSNNNTLKRLPNSITRLQSLQTLNLHCCYALEELPSDIRKLVNLRNLYIDGCHKLSYLPRGIGELSSLQRLTHFILPKDRAHAKNYCRLGELKGLNNIRGQLSIENLGYITNAEVKCEVEILMGKHSLESLVLSWGNFNTDDAVIDEVLFERLKPPSNLQRCEHLPPLDQLPCLESLHIHDMPELEYIESGQSSLSTASFPSLSILKIYKCKKLKELNLYLANGALLINQMMLGLNKLKRLNIEAVEFPECLPEEGFQSLTSLESLSIWKCHQLTSLWQGMRHLSSLVHLSIWECEELDILKMKAATSWISMEAFKTHNLEDLNIWYCDNLKAISEQIEALQSLQSLDIDRCPSLTSFPEAMRRLTSLTHLTICGCPKLEESCKRQAGEDWDKIAHI
ncbi:hypothetical protein EUGRSUZ_B01256, partial [Eucalyptus grandis]